MRLNLGLTAEQPCSYLEDKQSRSLMVVDEELLSPFSYEALLEHGYRRSGDHAYRPWCRDCKQCHAVRVPVEDFVPNRSQRRCWKVNQDLQINWEQSELTDEQYALYLSYQKLRHSGGNMEKSSFSETEDFLVASWNEVHFMEMRQNGELVAVAVTDVHPQSLSAVYTFFKPELHRRSLGSYAIMQQLEYGKARGQGWLYLGYWIPESRKMAYKSAFKPLEVRVPLQDMSEEKWVRRC
jgi:arginine-tRNA-protein transferase